MPQDTTWQIALLALVTLLLNFLVTKRSQVDAWAESKPRVAGVMKLLRGLGIDPWLVVQGVTLIIKGRLPAALKPEDERPTPPDPPRKLPLIMMLALAALSCGADKQGPPCDQATLAGIVAECSVKVEQECASKGIGEADCQPLKDCDKRLDDRAEKCR